MTASIVLNRFDYQRPDGYVNATKLCQSAGKQWGHYASLKGTKEYFEGLSRSIGIPIDQLIVTIDTGSNDQRGTWVHPEISVDLAKWISVEYRIQVNRWMVELHTTGSVEIEGSQQAALPPQRDLIDFVDAADKVEKMSFSPTLKRLLADSLIDELELKRNVDRLHLPAETKARYTICKVRAKELGYKESQVGSGSQLGRYVAARIPCAFVDSVGKYGAVKHYAVGPELDAAIESFFLR